MPSSEVMPKWKAGELHSGSKKGPVVKNQKQAVAIMLSEKQKEAKHGGKYPEKKAYQDGGEVFKGEPMAYRKGGKIKKYDDGGSVGDVVGQIVDKFKSTTGKDAPKIPDAPKMPAAPASLKGGDDVITSPTNIPIVGQKKGGTVGKSSWRRYGW
jgi:Family of unknown function (DUF6496)